jgi:hypothetical protein
VILDNFYNYIQSLKTDNNKEQKKRRKREKEAHSKDL